MNIGERIKNLRQRNDLTQEELADRCELSKGYISQLENDLTSPSIATLVDLLTALGSNLADFFCDSNETRITFGEEDYFQKVTDATTIKWLIPTAQKNRMEPIELCISPRSSTERDLPHEGEEFGLVLEGQVVVEIAKQQYTCCAGESFYFRADKPHRLLNTTDQPARLLWVTSPPNF